VASKGSGASGVASGDMSGVALKIERLAVTVGS